MFRLPFLFIITGIASFVLFHALSLFSLGTWIVEPPRQPDGWFRIHMLVLDWGTMIAMGAVYQLMDVVLQRKIYSMKLGYIHYVVFTLGTATLLTGFYLGENQIVAFGAVFALLGIALFCWNAGATLLLAKKWNPITLSAACAIAYLGLTAIIGSIMGLNFAFDVWWEGHDRMLAAHIWLGTLGWFGLLITGFSYKMLPMFYLAHGVSDRLEKAVLALWNAGVLLGAASLFFGWGVYVNGAAVVCILAALYAYDLHIREIQRLRHKKSPGSGIWWTVICNRALIAGGLVLYAALLANPGGGWNEKLTLLAGWLYLGGWTAMTILGYMSKIVPFLWWTHKYGPLAGKQSVPVMSDLIRDRSVLAGLFGIAVGTLSVLTGIAGGWDALVIGGNAVLSLFSLFYIGLIARVFLR